MSGALKGNTLVDEVSQRHGGGTGMTDFRHWETVPAKYGKHEEGSVSRLFEHEVGDSRRFVQQLFRDRRGASPHDELAALLVQLKQATSN